MNRFVAMKLLAVFVAILVSLGLVEVILRITREERIEPVLCRQFDVNFDTVLVPGSLCRFKTGEWDVFYKVNSWGVRGAEFDFVKPKETFRIIVVGDSFVEGFGLSEDERFAKRLSDKLNGLGKGSFEVIGAGVAGHGTLQKSRALLLKWLKFDPDLVIFEFNVTDFKEDLDASARLKDDLFEPPILYKEEERPIVNKSSFFGFVPDSWKHFLNQNIYFYQFLNTWSKIGLANLSGKNVRSYTLGDAFDLFAVTREKEPGDYQRLWEIPEESIGEVINQLNEKAIPLVIMLIPHGHLVDGNQWGLGRQYWGFERGKIYSDRAFSDLKARFENATILDLTLSLRDNSSSKLYFERDGHFNYTGSGVVAETMFNFLIENKLLK